MKCGVRLILNGGGNFISSGEDVNIEVIPPYLPEKPAGLVEIEQDDENQDCSNEYYTLNGNRVTRPDKGIYIVKSGKKARKEYKL